MKKSEFGAWRAQSGRHMTKRLTARPACPGAFETFGSLPTRSQTTGEGLKMPKFMNRIGAGAIMLMVLSVPGFAQTTSGNLIGTVFDAMNAGVPNAMVTATSEATNVASTTMTTSSG